MSISAIPKNHVFARLQDEEVRLLFKPYLSQSPFRSVEPEDLTTTILCAEGSVSENLLRPEAIYTATVVGAQTWWDSYLGVKDIVILLDSPDLLKRHAQIKDQSGLNSVYDTYVPHIVLAYDIPNPTPRNRWWFNEILQQFSTRYKGTVIRFSDESVEDSAGNLPIRGSEALSVKPVE